MLETEKIGNMVVDLAKAYFNDNYSLSQIKKLKLSEERQRDVSLGLTMVGITLLSDYGIFHVLPRNINNRNEIKSRIMHDTLTAFAHQTIAEGITSRAFGNLWDSTLKLIGNDINKGIQNPEYIWGENDRGGLNMGGILGVVLKRVFQAESTSEIFAGTEVDLFTFIEVAGYFDIIYKSSIESFPEDLGKILSK